MSAPKLIPCDGKLVTVRDLAERAGIHTSAVLRRLKRGWTPERVASTPKVAPGKGPNSKRVRHDFRGEERSLKEIADATGHNRCTVFRRLKKGQPVEAPLHYRGNNPRAITHEGRTQNITAWAKELGMETKTLARRLNELRWSVKRALTEPLRPRSRAPKTNAVIVKEISHA